MKTYYLSLCACALTLTMAFQIRANDSASSEYKRDAENSAEAILAPADNTKKNIRDRNKYNLTPEDQIETESDRRIIQEIRKEVISDKTLSFNAKNIKIISLGGVVTLRGPVKNSREKESIAILAKGIAGVSLVNDKLEVTKNGKKK